MATRTNADIVKGSKLMLFYNGAPIGFATSHTLNITTNTAEIMTKDHGDYPSQVVQSISWEVTAENLYSDAGEITYMTIMKGKQPVTIKFAAVSNWYDGGGVIDNSNTDWAPDAGNTIAEGQALITSYSINAPSGDNATMSVTFTGIGELTTNVDN